MSSSLSFLHQALCWRRLGEDSWGAHFLMFCGYVMHRPPLVRSRSPKRILDVWPFTQVWAFLYFLKLMGTFGILAKHSGHFLYYPLYRCSQNIRPSSQNVRPSFQVPSKVPHFPVTYRFRFWETSFSNNSLTRLKKAFDTIVLQTIMSNQSKSVQPIETLLLSSQKARMNQYDMMYPTINRWLKQSIVVDSDVFTILQIPSHFIIVQSFHVLMTKQSITNNQLKHSWLSALWTNFLIRR